MFNYTGMNIFNAKVGIVTEIGHDRLRLSALAVGNAIRMNVPT
jgi:hypothetical protein